jgi:enoyl-CoA hydratase/carnithine racemase
MAAEPTVRPAVSIEPAAGYVVARLAHERANPLGPVVLDGLEAAVQTVEELGARALVITSSLDGFFAAGADIKHMRTLDGDGFAAYGAQMRRVFARISAMPAVSIAAIDGLALGGGMELAFACTLRIGSTRAQLGLPEIHLGLIPGAGGTQRLPRLAGRGRALDILLTGRQVPAAEAHAIGLLERLVPAGDAERVAIEIAEHLATASAPALAAIHRCVDVALSEDLETGIAFEADEEQLLFVDGEAGEGLAAFLERRAPSFRSDGPAPVRHG